MRELINITTYPVPHYSKGGTGGVTYVTYNGNTGINNSNANTGRMNFNSVDGGEGTFTYILAQGGTIVKLEGDELNYNIGFIGELTSDKITTGQLKADDAEILKAYIGTLDSKKITTEYLTVTKQAHFFELIIDKVRAVGGQIILTPAQCLADVVIPRDASLNPVNLYTSDGELVSNIATLLRQVKYFDVYYKSKNSEGIEVSNEWFADENENCHDQAFCQSFNIEAGTHRNVSNKYYWRQVYSLLPDKMVNLVTSEVVDLNSQLTSTNNIHIKMKPTSYEGTTNNITWQAAAQNLNNPNIQQTVSWENLQDPQGETNAINGIMKTNSTWLGVHITPTGDNYYHLTDKLEFSIYYTNADGTANYGLPESVKIGVLYKEGKSEFFSSIPADGILNLHPDNSIESIVIVDTEDVQWVKCHGIRLSNDINDPKSMDPETIQAIQQGGSIAQASIPEKGDSIVQLGYQSSGPDDPNAELEGYSRQSAIIIAAYHTPDTDLIAPSYAQYMGINDYDLKSHRGSYIDGIGAKFIGTHGGDISMCIVDDQGHTVTSMVLDQQGIHTEVNGLSGQVATFEMTVQGFNATVQQYSQDVNGYSQQVSTFSQTVSGFNTTVSNYTTAVNGYSQQVSTFSQTVNGFSTQVSNYESAVNGYTNEYTTIVQNYNNIKAEVVSDINGQLLTTGIDIVNKQITLKADKTILENVTSSSATWLKGNVNGSTKWDLAINSYSPIMRFGNTSSLTNTTYITTDSLHINTDGYNTNFATLQVVSNEPSLFLKQGSNSIELRANNQPYLEISRGTKNVKLYINSSGDICLEGTFLHNGSTSSRKVLVLDGDGFLKLQ